MGVLIRLVPTQTLVNPSKLHIITAPSPSRRPAPSSSPDDLSSLWRQNTCALRINALADGPWYPYDTLRIGEPRFVRLTQSRVPFHPPVRPPCSYVSQATKSAHANGSNAPSIVATRGRLVVALSLVLRVQQTRLGCSNLFFVMSTVDAATRTLYLVVWFVGLFHSNATTDVCVRTMKSPFSGRRCLRVEGVDTATQRRHSRVTTGSIFGGYFIFSRRRFYTARTTSV